MKIDEDSKIPGQDLSRLKLDIVTGSMLCTSLQSSKSIATHRTEDLGTSSSTLRL